MTRAQLTFLGVLSLLATVVVLIAGRAPSQLDGLPAALRASATTAEETPAAGAAATASASSSDDGDGDASAAAASGSEESFDDDGGGDVSADDVAAEVGDDGSATAAGDETGGEEPAGDEEAADEDSGGGEAPEEEAPRPTKVRHVFVVALHGHGYDAVFGDGAESRAPYLTRTLRRKGVVLSGYRSLASAELPDHLALVGGQPPNADTRADCPVFREIPPTARAAGSGEIRADGCVFPNTVITVGDQLSATRRSWRAYVEDLDRGEPRRATCRRPESNGADATLRGRVGDGYATRRNPFVYFHSLLDLGDCDANDGALERLERDLRAAKTTPSLSWIAPNLCDAGTESPCADGTPGGLPAADAFLARWAPRILASPAYRKGGLLLVVFAGGSGEAAPVAEAARAGGVGAARADGAAADGPLNGALLLSPFARGGTTAASAYDPYALLRSIQDLFALRPIARATSAASFAPTILADAYHEPPSDG